MLRQLHIENLVLARDVILDFSTGLNLITGETGAGKSLISGALALCCGARGDSALVRRGSERALVEAVFELGDRPDVLEHLRRAGYDAEDGELLLRREVGRDGRTRAFLGGSPITTALLRELTAGLVELHGQHEPQVLLQPATQRELLDSFGGHAAHLVAVRRASIAVRDLRHRLQELEERTAGRESRIELLRFRLGEFDQVAPESGDEERLRAERERLRHAEEIALALQSAIDTLYEGEGAAADLIHAALRRLQAQAQHGEAFAGYAERLDDLHSQLTELAGELRSEAERTVADPERLAAVEERLHALERLRRRFDGAPLEEIIGNAAALRAELEQLEDAGQSGEALELELARQRGAWEQAAEKLSAARASAARKLERAVDKLLGQLAMSGAGFRVGLEPEEGSGVESETGRDRVEFLLQANPGEPARPLRRVASGGELSRVMLAIDIALESSLSRRTLLFDEVDQGLGGEAAAALGGFLLRVAKTQQVIAITHLPQVAALAEHHITVAKKVRSGRTVAVVKALEEIDDRIQELARMLGGSVVTDGVLRHAEELIRAPGAVPRPGRGQR